MTKILERLRNGWSASASGDVIIVPKPGWIQYSRSGTTHGSPFAYDTHVPLLFYGWHVPAGITYERTHIRDIAPTVAALIHSPMPNATGAPSKTCSIDGPPESQTIALTIRRLLDGAPRIELTAVFPHAGSVRRAIANVASRAV